jgi:hypothetical protein
VAQCFYCSAEAEVLSERVNASGDLKTLELSCGHRNTVAIIQSLSRFSTAELKKKISDTKQLAKLRNISKATHEAAVAYLAQLEAELADRRA